MSEEIKKINELEERIDDFESEIEDIKDKINEMIDIIDSQADQIDKLIDIVERGYYEFFDSVSDDISDLCDSREKNSDCEKIL